MQRNTFFLLLFILLSWLTTYSTASTEQNFSSQDTKNHLPQTHESPDDWHTMADLADALDDDAQEWEQLEQAPARWSRWQACKAACKTIYAALCAALIKAREDTSPC